VDAPLICRTENKIFVVFFTVSEPEIHFTCSHCDKKISTTQEHYKCRSANNDAESFYICHNCFISNHFSNKYYYETIDSGIKEFNHELLFFSIHNCCFNKLVQVKYNKLSDYYVDPSQKNFIKKIHFWDFHTNCYRWCDVLIKYLEKFIYIWGVCKASCPFCQAARVLASCESETKLTRYSV